MSNDTTTPAIKVGDELAFRVGYGHGRYVIHKVERITPTGRICAGPYTLEANLRVRGRQDYSSPHEAERVTDKIRESIARREAIDLMVRMTKSHEGFNSTPTETLVKVASLLRGESTE